MEGLEVVLRRFGYGGSLDGVARRHTRGRDLSDAKEETQSETVSTSCKSVSEGVMMHQSLVQSRFGLEESTRGGRSLQFGPQRQVGGFRERLVDERALRTTSSFTPAFVPTTTVLVGT